MSNAAGKRHLVTVAVEDYFQVGAFNRLVQQGRWYRFEKRVERNTRRALDLLESCDVHGTFFALGWVAQELPELIAEIADRGHEVASKGFYHRSVRAMSPAEFRDDLVRSREALERACGRRVWGYRVADDWLGPQDLWALDVLAEEGFAYDSSICPIMREFHKEPWRRFEHVHRTAEGKEIVEFPLSSADVFGWHVPVAGGNYYRQFPHRWMKRAFQRWEEQSDSPFVMYFQVWELDPEQPKIQAASWLTRLRHYRNLGKLNWVLRDYLEGAPFTGIGEYLGLDLQTPASVPTVPRPVTPPFTPRPSLTVGSTEATPVTIVVPCYNEELVLPYLARTLEQMEKDLSATYAFRYVFVDDCSTDHTRSSLMELFGSRPGNRVLHHETNRGVARAILTGIEAAETDIVASIDCDCTYDPRQLESLLPQIVNADVVTASPYHKDGEVRNVPGWRLFLSRGLSRLYHRVLHHKLATYTSCFRVYRRSSMESLPIREGGFLGVAETLGVLDLRGARIVECPAVLEVRMLGRSKMKIVKTILGHLGLLVRLAKLRMTGMRKAASLPPSKLESRPGEAANAEGKVIS